MSDILKTAADYKLVRSVIDTQVDKRILPDETIKEDPFLGVAERWAKERDPSWESRANDELTQLKTAVAYKTASLCYPTIAPKITVNISANDLAVTRQYMTPTKRIADLLAKAEEAMQELLNPSNETVEAPTFFMVASSGRGS